MTRLTLELLAVTVVTSGFAAEPEKQWRAVEGAQLQASFAGKELGDGTHYAYAFRHDGTFTGVEMGKDVRGTWKSTPRQLCWTWTKPRGSEECYEVRRSGNDVRLFRNGYETLSGTLRPAPAK